MTKNIHDMSLKRSAQYVREAGCECEHLALDYKPEVGPRCNRCNTQVVMVHRGGYVRHD